MKPITRKILQTLFTKENHWQHIYSYSARELQYHLNIDEKRANFLYRAIHSSEAYEAVKETEKQFGIITIFDPQYPTRLREIPDPPFVLYANGELNCLNQERIISMIGTRFPSIDAKAKVSHLISPLVTSGWLIASGFALGIDSMAHRTTIQHGGQTIAVLGGGFHHIYPKQHEYLYEQISKNGVLLSEYPPFVRPQKYHFPERNRIISGLSLATIVVEAKEKSGTMITVDQALEQGREVYAVPGNPLIEQTIGCHRLIQDGAKLIINGDDILTEWDHLYDNKN